MSCCHVLKFFLLFTVEKKNETFYDFWLFLFLCWTVHLLALLVVSLINLRWECSQVCLNHMHLTWMVKMWIAHICYEVLPHNVCFTNSTSLIMPGRLCAPAVRGSSQLIRRYTSSLPQSGTAPCTALGLPLAQVEATGQSKSREMRFFHSTRLPFLQASQEHSLNLGPTKPSPFQTLLQGNLS